MTENRVSAVVSQADLEAVMGAIETIRTKLPFLISLTREERRKMLKLGDGSVAFVEGAADIAAQHAALIPAAFDMGEWQKDAALLTVLNSIDRALLPLSESIDDTLMEVGSEAYAAALAAYHYLKDGNQSGELDGLLDQLGQRFAKRTAHKVPPQQT